MGAGKLSYSHTLKLFPLCHFKVSILMLPTHGALFLEPALMLHRADHIHVGIGKCVNHFVSNGSIGVETANGIKVLGKSLCLLNIGKLVLQGQVVEVLLHLFFRQFVHIALEIAGVKCNCEIIQVQETALGDKVLYAAYTLGKFNTAAQSNSIFAVDGNAFLYILNKRRLALSRLELKMFSVCRYHLRISSFNGEFDFHVSSALFQRLIHALLHSHIVMIYGAYVVAVKLKLAPHGVYLATGFAAVGYTIPALQLIAEHEHIGERVGL